LKLDSNLSSSSSSVNGGWCMTGSVSLGEETSSSVGITTAESVGASAHPLPRTHPHRQRHL
nr:hypothetical protein [Tanacetum cinerariifolium]